MLTAAGDALVEDDGPRQEQAAVVLGGDGFGTRITKAAELARAGYVKCVLVSGPAAFGGHECDFSIPHAESEGFPASMFRAVPNESDSTRTEAQFFKIFLRQNGIHGILLVTSVYHTRRAARIFRKAIPDLQFHVIPAPDPFYTPATWWKTRSGQKTFLLELTKTIANQLGI